MREKVKLEWKIINSYFRGRREKVLPGCCKSELEILPESCACGDNSK